MEKRCKLSWLNYILTYIFRKFLPSLFWRFDLHYDFSRVFWSFDVFRLFSAGIWVKVIANKLF